MAKNYNKTNKGTTNVEIENSKIISQKWKDKYDFIEN